MNKNVFTAVLVIFLAVILLPCYSSVIKLKNGKVIEGEIVQRADDYIKVDVYGVPLTYYLSDIETISEDVKPAPVEVKPGKSASVTGNKRNPDISSAGDTTVYLNAEIFKIPEYGDNPNYNINDIAYGAGKVYFANDYAWGEINYAGRKFDPRDSFMAATDAYKIKAVAFSPDGSAVFDVVSNSIIVGNVGQYTVAGLMKDPKAMTYYKGYFYLACAGSGQVYIIQIKGKQGQVVRSFKTLQGVCGIASDENDLYICDDHTIYRYSAGSKIVKVYKTGVSINGIAVTGRDEFVAPAKSGNTIYILSEGL